MPTRRHLIITALLGVALALVAAALQSQPGPSAQALVPPAQPATPAARLASAPYGVVGPAQAPPAPVDLQDLRELNHLSDLQIERAAWRGGGIVSCDLSSALPDGQDLALTVASPERASMDFQLDVTTWNHGNHWPVVHLVAATQQGQVELFVQHPTDRSRAEVLTLAWADATDEHPVACTVVDRRPTRQVTVHLDPAGAWWRSPELVAVVGCGQTRVVRPDKLDPVQIQVAEPCSVHTWRTVAITSARSAPIALSITGPSSVTLPIPHVPVVPDPGMTEVAIDAAVFAGLDAADALLVAAEQQLDERWPEHTELAVRTLNDLLSPSN